MSIQSYYNQCVFNPFDLPEQSIVSNSEFNAINLKNQQFSVLFENDYNQPLRFLGQGIDNHEDLASQLLVPEAFSKILEKNVEHAYLLAEFCVDKTNLGCQKLIKEDLPRLKNPAYAEKFAIENKKTSKVFLNYKDLITLFETNKIKDYELESIFREKFDYSSEIPETASAETLSAIFSQILEEESFYGSLANRFATACIGKESQACQSLVKEAFPKLLEKDPYAGRYFAEQCIEKEDQACKSLVKDALPKLIEKDPFQGRLFAELCIEKEDQTCLSLVKDALPKLIQKDSLQGMFVAQKCIGKESQACQSLVKDAFSKLAEKNSFYPIYLAQKCFGKEDQVCNSLLEGAFSQLLKINIFTALQLQVERFKYKEPLFVKECFKTFDTLKEYYASF